jgi:PPE-repeat protein
MSTSAQRKAPEPDIAAAAAAAGVSAREKDRARRRRQAAMHDYHRGYRYEFLDSGSGAEPDPIVDPRLSSSAVASEQGAGALGFAGTARKDAAEAAGLATLAGDEFGGGPSIPMVPRTWEPNQRELGEGEDDS